MRCRPKECFLDPDGGTSHTLAIPLDKCGTKVDDNGFHTNTIILQVGTGQLTDNLTD